MSTKVYMEYAEANAANWPSYWIPILLEVARTAVAADEALAELERWKRMADVGFEPLHAAVHATRAAHRAALEKLKP